MGNTNFDQMLNEAVDCDDLPSARQALDAGASPIFISVAKSGDGEERAPVLFKSCWQSLELVHFLLERGADANAPCVVEESTSRCVIPPLYLACQWRSLELVSLLLEHRANPNGRYEFSAPAGNEWQDCLLAAFKKPPNYWDYPLDYLGTRAARGKRTSQKNAVKITELLLAHGAIVQSTEGYRDDRTTETTATQAAVGLSEIQDLLRPRST